MNEYFIYYTESNVVCLIIFLILLVHDLLNVDRQERQVKYDHALIAFMLYFVSDVVWAGVTAKIIPKNMISVSICSFSNYILMATITYMWLRYVMAVEQAPNRERPINKFAVSFPFLIATVALIITFIAAPGALFDENLNYRPLFNVFLITVPIINITAVLAYTMKKAIKEVDPIEKKRHLYIGLFPILTIVGGLAQVILLPTTPVFCFCCAILMLMVYIQFIETQISMDPLTKLNNRGQLLRYISQSSNLYMDNRRTYVMMVDINDFKLINDTYGHAEGDKALVILADALRNSVKNKEMPTFVSRYGGDEFTLIVHPTTVAEVEALIVLIRKNIEECCAAAESQYVISVGIGVEELIWGQDTIQKCMQRADKKLYIDKEKQKALLKSSV